VSTTSVSFRMPSLGGPELLLVAAIMLIVFGAGKIPETLGQLGKGVRDFRAASEGKDAAIATESAAAPIAKVGPLCANCGKPSGDARFCPHCGTAVPALK
jgi:sec-independent protein translocase protein TatA